MIFLFSPNISTHYSLSAYFKSLAFILFEILHLQNCDVKFQNCQRAITKKKLYDFFLISPDNQLIVLYQLFKVPSLNTYTFRDIAFAMSKISKKGNY